MAPCPQSCRGGAGADRSSCAAQPRAEEERTTVCNVTERMSSPRLLEMGKHSARLQVRAWGDSPSKLGLVTCPKSTKQTSNTESRSRVDCWPHWEEVHRPCVSPKLTASLGPGIGLGLSRGPEFFIARSAGQGVVTTSCLDLTLVNLGIVWCPCSGSKNTNVCFLKEATGPQTDLLHINN